jgi:hypothetical protein
VFSQPSRLRAPELERGAEEPGQNESAILLQAIRIVASKPQNFIHDCALRDLVRKYAHQFSLDF